MKINFKQGKYIFPLVCLLPIFVIFYVFQSSAAKNVKVEEKQEGLQENIADVSGTVKEGSITNKLDAFRNQYKEGDGATAISTIDTDPSQLGDSLSVEPDEEYLASLDNTQSNTKRSYNRSTSGKYNRRGTSQEDAALAQALNTLAQGSKSTQNKSSYTPQRSETYNNQSEPQVDQDPMEVFKKQMSYVDSMSRAGDPEYKAEQMRLKAIEKAEKELASKPKLAVVKADATPKVFNTVRIKQKDSFVKAIIDENVKGYAGSRIRLRLLEDITVGGNLVKRGTYIYAQVSSFSEQRVGLSIISIIKENKIFPVHLEIYDLDGMPGLYVPASEFREFTKELGGNSIQGVNLGLDPQNTSQFMMSAVQKMFTSTSQAIASLIRKNKAKLKYNTYIYLIDPQELQNQQSNY
jgi:conjugative transposon TraM protein